MMETLVAAASQTTIQCLFNLSPAYSLNTPRPKQGEGAIDGSI